MKRIKKGLWRNLHLFVLLVAHHRQTDNFLVLQKIQ
jgi:hypothetical protein